MSGNSFGTAFRITTAGESHGPGNVVIIDGMPAGMPLDETDLHRDLERRRPGQSKITSQRKEPDRPEILSGVFQGKTTGTSIAIQILSKDQKPRDYSEIKDKYRPGHADYSYDAKFGFRDYRGGGRASARETNVRVAAGAVAKKFLHTYYGVEIVGYVKQIGDLIADIPNPEDVTMDQVESNVVRCPDSDIAEQMIELIDAMRKDLDSIGGVSEMVATGVPAGWGEPVFDKLKADLAKGMLSIPAVLGFEYGSGFGAARLRGSENNDRFINEGGQIKTETNRHGGILGGISTGMPIVARCVVKPTSSLAREQESVDQEGENITMKTTGRHDPCLVPRFVPIGEAMMAIVLADHALRQHARDYGE